MPQDNQASQDAMKKLWIGIPHTVKLPDAPVGWEKEKIPHTTIIYLGKTPAQDIARIEERIRAAKLGGLLQGGSITYDHIAFLGRDKDRYVTASAEEFADAQKLYDAAVRVLDGHFERDSWDKYKAHMTIWKNRTGSSELSDEELMPPFALPITFALDRLVLFESIGGGNHEELLSIELQ